MAAKGFGDTKCEGNYLYARPLVQDEWVNHENKIGMIRVSWEFKEAGEATVVGQQALETKTGRLTVVEHKLKGENDKEACFEVIKNKHCSANEVLSEIKASYASDFSFSNGVSFIFMGISLFLAWFNYEAISKELAGVKADL